MHTSTRLAASDFAFAQQTHTVQRRLTFAEFCPVYHELDRVGVVSLCLEDGVIHTGRTLLALTTAFYDCHRARSVDFFDYPQHFAFVGVDKTGIRTCTGGLPHAPSLWDAWSWLDVWPAHKWVTTSPTATAMLGRVFDYQINRLFWPQELGPATGEKPLPEYAYKMLRTRLKSVYYYSTSTGFGTEEPLLEVQLSASAETLWQESLDRLPPVTQPSLPLVAKAVDRFRWVDSHQFVTSMQL